MLNRLKKFFNRMHDENGQAVVVVVVSLSLLLGCAALVVDLGGDYRAKMKVQDAADFAALAAAKSLSDVSQARAEAVSVASSNGVLPENVTVTTPYENDSKLVEVVCTIERPHFFAGIFGSRDAELTGRAVAQMIPPQWSGAALPLLNVSGTQVGDDICVWRKNSPGNFGVLDRKHMTWVEEKDGVPAHYDIEYELGVYTENGQIGQLKKYLEKMCADGRTVYIFSVADGVDSVKVGQGVLISSSKLVLLECTVSSYNFGSIDLGVERIYDIYGNAGNGPEVPEDFTFQSEGYTSKLVD